MRTRIRIVTGILVAWCIQTAFAQSDSITKGPPFSNDSLFNFYENSDDERLEQSLEPEDSPLMDLLGDESTESDHIRIRSRLIRRFQTPVGYTHGTYQGSALKSYQRILVRQGRLSGGILSTKDPGEGPLNDFMTANLAYQSAGVVSKFVAGDYRIEAGQGIALWRGYGLTKGPDIVASVLKRARGIVTSLSSDEAGYFRGGAATFVTGPISSTWFYSYRSLNAALDTHNTVTSFYHSGYFRTAAEQRKRNVVEEKIFGAHAFANLSGIGEIGFSVYSSEFSQRLSLDGGGEFSGTDRGLYAMDYKIQFGRMAIFGEWTYANSVIGGISGVLVRPSDDISIIGAGRCYPGGFFSPHGFGFSERLGTSNENGFFFGVEMRFGRFVRMSSYYDQFDFPENTASSKFSSAGSDLLVRFAMTPMHRLTLAVHYQHQLADRTDTIMTGSGLIGHRTISTRRHRFRIQADYRLSDGLRLRHRVESALWDGRALSSPEKGLLFYTDIMLEPGGRISIDFRAASFKTDSYASRVSTVERDLEGVLTIPALYGSGVRWYILVTYQAGSHLMLSAKYSDLLRDDVKYLGSGADEIEGNHDDRIGLQAEISF